MQKNKNAIIPIKRPKSPILFIINAFVAARAAEGLVNQKPINR